MQADADRVVVLWGPAWSGKSTLCRAMLRCLPLAADTTDYLSPSSRSGLPVDTTDNLLEPHCSLMDPLLMAGNRQ